MAFSLLVKQHDLYLDAPLIVVRKYYGAPKDKIETQRNANEDDKEVFESKEIRVNIF